MKVWNYFDIFSNPIDHGAKKYLAVQTLISLFVSMLLKIP